MLKEGMELIDGMSLGLGLGSADTNNNNNNSSSNNHSLNGHGGGGLTHSLSLSLSHSHSHSHSHSLSHAQGHGGGNSKEKSYSLRPRTCSAKKDDEAFENYDAWKPRGRTKKRMKQKPQPLSKYRRKTANARERSRMREINEAFEALRRIIPQLGYQGDSNNSEKLTKISTLRSAMKYISALRRVLQEPYDHDSDGDSLLSDCTLTTQRSLRDHDPDTDLTSPSFNDHSLTAPFSDHILVSCNFDLDDSVGSLGGGFATPPHPLADSPNYQNSCFSTSHFHDPDDHDSDLDPDPDHDSTQQLIDVSLTSTVFDSCYELDSPVLGAQFS